MISTLLRTQSQSFDASIKSKNLFASNVLSTAIICSKLFILKFFFAELINLDKALIRFYFRPGFSPHIRLQPEKYPLNSDL